MNKYFMAKQLWSNQKWLKLTMNKINMAKLTTSKINMAKPTNE
jgi:hypothetical protein